MTDPDGVATSWNQGVKDLLGYDEHDFLGKHLSELIFTDEAIEEGVPKWEFEISVYEQKTVHRINRNTVVIESR